MVRFDAMIVDAVRSPIGRKNGTLSHIRADELGALVYLSHVWEPKVPRPN